jgi:hypothetical protein
MRAMEDDSEEIVQRLFRNLQDKLWAEDFAVARLFRGGDLDVRSFKPPALKRRATADCKG